MAQLCSLKKKLPMMGSQCRESGPGEGGEIGGGGGRGGGGVHLSMCQRPGMGEDSGSL